MYSNLLNFFICNNKNFRSYILDDKGNEGPKCNLFIIVEYFFTKY